MIVVTNNGQMGQNLKALRRKYNLSQEAFAQFSGLDIDVLNNIEQGIVLEINAQILSEICKEFCVTVQMLIEDTI